MDVDGATLAFVDILIKGTVGYVLLGTYSGYATEVFIPALGFVIRLGTGGDVEDASVLMDSNTLSFNVGALVAIEVTEERDLQA